MVKKSKPIKVTKSKDLLKNVALFCNWNAKTNEWNSNQHSAFVESVMIAIHTQPLSHRKMINFVINANWNGFIIINGCWIKRVPYIDNFRNSCVVSMSFNCALDSRLDIPMLSFRSLCFNIYWHFGVFLFERLSILSLSPPHHLHRFICISMHMLLIAIEDK